MSRWTKFRDTVLRPALGIAGKMSGNPILAAAGTAAAAYKPIRSVNALSSETAGWEMSSPSVVNPSGSNVPVMASLPAIIRGGAVAGRAAGALGRALSPSAVARSAATYCRRHPAWCATIGLTGVAELVSSGSLPPVKRRRSRGITGTELKNFKRVSGVLNRWCKVPAPTQRARRKVC